jgi:hypothetical protein
VVDVTTRLTALRENRWTMRVVIVLLALAFALSLGYRLSSPAQAKRHYAVPQNSTMESKLGVRFVAAQLVGDGGIISLRYQVLDLQKAYSFANDVHHPPVLHDENRSQKTAVYRTAIMPPSHNIRPGETYTLIYFNNGRTVHRGDLIQVDAGGGRLVHVPVE